MKALTGAYEGESRLADVVTVGIAFDGEGGDVVELSRAQALQHIGGVLPLQKVGFPWAPSNRCVGDGKATDEVLGDIGLIPAQFHLTLLHPQHMQTRRRQQV